MSNIPSSSSPPPQSLLPNTNSWTGNNTFSNPITANIIGHISVKTSNYTITASDDIIACNASSGAFTVTLPTAVGVQGTDYTIKKEATDTSINVITVATTSSQTIDGNATFPLTDVGQSITVTSDGANWQVTRAYLPKKYQVAGFNVVGHSYTDNTNDSGYAPFADSDTMVARFAGIVGAFPQNINHLGQFASQLTNQTGFFGGPDAGWLGVLKYIRPKNDLNVETGLTLQTDRLASSINPTLIIHGINDLNANSSSSSTQGITAWKNALTTTISRARAASIYGSYTTGGGSAGASWNSAFSVSGFTSTTGTQYTGPATYNSSTNGSTLTYTVPSQFTGATIAFNFIGQLNGYTTLASAITTTTATSISVSSASNFPTSGTLTIIIDSEQMLVTAGLNSTTWTVTRGVNGTTKATHLISAPVQVAQNAGVSWTTNGSNATITGTTILSGQGYNNANVTVTQRFALTGADAGKTITATVTGLTASDTSAAIIFDSVWFEAPEPSHVCVTNIVAVNNGNYGGNTVSIVNTWNTATNTVIANFDQYVKLVDINSAIQNQSVVLATSMTTSTTSISVTANSTSCPTSPGFRITSCNGSTTAGEDMLVTAISGTYPNYTWTVSRAANGSTATTHNIGDAMTVCSWLHTDDLHPNIYGSGAFAQLIYNVFVTVPTSYYQQGLMSQGYTRTDSLPVLGMVNGGNNYPTGGGAVTTSVLTVSQQYWFPIYVPQQTIFTGMGLYISTGVTSATVRFGIYNNNPERARPSGLMLDFGTKAAATSSQQISISNVCLILFPGVYWLSCAQQGGASGVTTATFGGSSFNINTGGSAISGNTGGISGWSQSGVTGAFGAPGSYTSVTTGMPYMWWSGSAPHNVFV